MNDQEAPRDLTFVSLLFLALLLYLVFAASPSIESGVIRLLVSVPISVFGIAVYMLGDRLFEGIKFKLPRTWQEWILLYFLGLIAGGVIVAPVMLAITLLGQ